MNENILTNIENNVGYLILNKPPLNILNIKDLNAFHQGLNALNEAKDTLLIVIKSNLENFSSGFDIKEHNTKDLPEIIHSLSNIGLAMLECNCPVITMVKGLCLGGGMEIALLSDIILANKSAKFGQPEIKLAHMAPISINILPEIIGNKQTSDLILSGKIIDAESAYNYGLISRLYENNEYNKNTQAYIEELCKHSKIALTSNIKALRSKTLQIYKKNQEIINQIYLKELNTHNDSQEGISAFIEKRKPVWTN